MCSVVLATAAAGAQAPDAGADGLAPSGGCAGMRTLIESDERTRLLYAGASRAIDSLAIVADSHFRKTLSC